MRAFVKLPGGREALRTPTGAVPQFVPEIERFALVDPDGTRHAKPGAHRCVAAYLVAPEVRVPRMREPVIPLEVRLRSPPGGRVGGASAHADVAIWIDAGCTWPVGLRPMHPYARAVTDRIAKGMREGRYEAAKAEVAVHNPDTDVVTACDFMLRAPAGWIVVEMKTGYEQGRFLQPEEQWTGPPLRRYPGFACPRDKACFQALIGAHGVALALGAPVGAEVWHVCGRLAQRVVVHDAHAESAAPFMAALRAERLARLAAPSEGDDGLQRGAPHARGAAPVLRRAGQDRRAGAGARDAAGVRARRAH